MKKNIIALFVLTAILSGTLIAQDSPEELSEYLDSEQVLTLTDAIQIAVANSPDVKRALLSVQDADELVRIAYSEVLPEISASANYTRNVEVPVSFLPAQIFDPTAPEGTLVPVEFGTDNNWTANFSVSQTIFRGEAIVGISSSSVFKTVQQEVYRSTVQQVVTQTRQAYYQVLIAKEQLRLQRAQINRLEENLVENRARLEAGMVEQYDVLQLEVQLSNRRPDIVEAEYAVAEAYRNLKVILGVPLNFDFSVQGRLNSYDILAEAEISDENRHVFKVDQMNPYEFQDLSADVEKVRDQRGDLRVLQAQLNLNEREVLAVKTRFLPTVSAVYNVSYTAAEPGALNPFQNPEPNTSPARAQTLGISVSLPIFNGFERAANVQRVQIERKDLQEQQRLARLQAENEIISAKEDLNKAFETAEARKAAIDQAQRGYEIALRRLENGLGSQLDVTEAELQVREAELNYATMVFNYLLAKARYDLATGMVPFVDTEVIN